MSFSKLIVESLPIQLINIIDKLRYQILFKGLLNLDLKKFQINSMTFNSKCFIIGKPCTGKTTLVKNILNFKINEADVIEIKTSFKENYLEYNKNNKINIYEAMGIGGERDLDNIIHFSSRNREKKIIYIEDEYLYYKNIYVNYWRLNSNFSHIRSIDSSIYFYQHENYANLPDYIFIFRENNIKTLKLIYKQLADILPSFQIFKNFFFKYTGNYNCIVIDNTTTSNKVKNNLYWYNVILN